MGVLDTLKKIADPLGIGEKAKEELGINKLKGKLGIDKMEQFEDFQLSHWWDMLKEDPERAILGIGTPVSSKFWGEIVGKDYDPMLNMMGGPSEHTFQAAQEAGIDVGPSATSHQIAAAIASIYAGGAGAGAIGGLAAPGAAGAGGATIGSLGGGAMGTALGTAVPAAITAGAAAGDELIPIEMQEILINAGYPVRGLTAGLPGMAEGGLMNYARGGVIEDPQEMMTGIQNITAIPGGGEMLMSVLADELTNGKAKGKTQQVRLFNMGGRSGYQGGGLANAAEMTRAGGRGDDDVLLHLSPEEFEAIEAMWGKAPINPETGIPEYGFLSDLWKGVKKVVKKIVKSPLFSFIAPIALNAFFPGAGAALGKFLGAGSGAMGAQVGNAIIKGGIGAASGGKEGALAGVVGSLTMGGGQTIGGEDVAGLGGDIGAKLGLEGAAAEMAGNAIIGGVGGEIGGGGFAQGAMGNMANAMMMKPINAAAETGMKAIFDPQTSGIGGDLQMGEGMSEVAQPDLFGTGDLMPTDTGMMSPVPGGAPQLDLTRSTAAPWYQDAWNWTKENPLMAAAGIGLAGSALSGGSSDGYGEGPEIPSNFLEGIPLYDFDRGRTPMPADLYYTYGVAGGPSEGEFDFFTNNSPGTPHVPGQPPPGTAPPPGPGPGGGGRGGPGGGRGNRGGGGRRHQQSMAGMQMPGMEGAGIPITDPAMAAQLQAAGYRIDQMAGMAYPPGFAGGGDVRGEGQRSFLPGLGPNDPRGGGGGPSEEELKWMNMDLSKSDSWVGKLFQKLQQRMFDKYGWHTETPFGDQAQAMAGMPAYAGGGYARGAGSGRDDTIEALLSDGEYVMDAETVSLLGDGSNEHGAERLDELRAKLRKHKGQALAKGDFSPDAKHPMQYLARGGRVGEGRIRKIARDEADKTMNTHIRARPPKGHGVGTRGGKRQRRYKEGGHVTAPLLEMRKARIASEQGEG